VKSECLEHRYLFQNILIQTPFQPKQNVSI
jgi:hypothetical protein